MDFEYKLRVSVLPSRCVSVAIIFQ